MSSCIRFRAPRRATLSDTPRLPLPTLPTPILLLLSGRKQGTVYTLPLSARPVRAKAQPEQASYTSNLLRCTGPDSGSNTAPVNPLLLKIISLEFLFRARCTTLRNQASSIGSQEIESLLSHLSLHRSPCCPSFLSHSLIHPPRSLGPCIGTPVDMRHQAELSLRRLLLTVSTFVLLTSGAAISAVRFLPEDPLHLRRSFTVYLVSFVAGSVIGISGAIKRNATLITLYAIHLLLDSILFFIPRILIIRFSFSLPSLICSNSDYPAFETEPVTSTSSAFSKTTHKIESSIKQLSSPAWSEGSCRVWLCGLETGFIVLLLTLMVLQAILGVKLYGYAAWLNRRKRTERMEKDLC